MWTPCSTSVCAVALTMIYRFYYTAFKDSVFVIQAEAEAVEHPDTMLAILRGIGELLDHGVRIAFVFGKGTQFTRELVDRFGARPHPQTNRLVIPENALPRMRAERSEIAARIETLCRSEGIPFRLLSESTVHAERRIGHESTGIVTGIDLHAIDHALDAGQLAVVGFGGLDETDQFLHVPSVSLAADLAVELNARKLLLLTHNDGIFLPGRKGGLQQLSFADLELLLCLLQKQDADGHFLLPDEIVPKVHASIRAVAGNVHQIHLVSYSRLLDEVLTRTGVGTMIERQQSHHVDYARPDDIDEIERLHTESLRYTTSHGTPCVKPLPRPDLVRLLPDTLVLKHRDTIVGKLHATAIPDATDYRLIGGYVISENHQDSQHGQLLLGEALARFREKGYAGAAAITASDRAKRLFERNGGVTTIDGPWQGKLLSQARTRYCPEERDAVTLYVFQSEQRGLG